MARIKVNPVLLLSFLDPTCQHGLIPQAIQLHRLGKTTLAICASISNQNDVEIDDITWLSYEEIKKQLDAVGRRYWIDWAIVSGIHDLNLAAALIHHLKKSRPGIHILWQPALKNSDEPSLHALTQQEQETFWSLCNNVHTVFIPAGNQDLLSQPIRLGRIQQLQCNVYLEAESSEANTMVAKLHSNGQEYELSPAFNLEEDVRFIPTLASYLYDGADIFTAYQQSLIFLSDKSH